MRIFFILLCIFLHVAAANADEALIFEDSILPIFKAKCAGCHFGENPKGGLDLSRRGNIVRGGKSGPAIRISAAESSLLFDVTSSGKMFPASIHWYDF